MASSIAEGDDEGLVTSDHVTQSTPHPPDEKQKETTENTVIEETAEIDFSSIPIEVTVQIVCKSFGGAQKENYENFKSSYPASRFPLFIAELGLQAFEMEKAERENAANILRDLLQENLVTQSIVIDALKEAVPLLHSTKEYAGNGIAAYADFMCHAFGHLPRSELVKELSAAQPTAAQALWTSIVPKVVLRLMVNGGDDEGAGSILAEEKKPIKDVQVVHLNGLSLDHTVAASLPKPRNREIENVVGASATVTATSANVVLKTTQQILAPKSTPKSGELFANPNLLKGTKTTRLDGKATNPAIPLPSTKIYDMPSSVSQILPVANTPKPVSKAPDVDPRRRGVPQGQVFTGHNIVTAVVPIRKPVYAPPRAATVPVPRPVPVPVPVPVPTHPWAKPPVPPNWEEACNTATRNFEPYTRVAVAAGSAEYRTLAALIGNSVGILKMDRIVNVEVWRRFVQARKELLIQKSDDLKLLQVLGLSDAELSRRSHVILNFQKEKALKNAPFSDNMVLLFHCSRGKVEDVLSQGLDERLSNTGTLGRGIYFAHEATKAMAYDVNQTLLVFGVLLGDCIDVSVSAAGAARGALVREPPKTTEQKRTPWDQFFDSIVGRPNGPVNEYVIFHRNQCCPLYAITYDASRPRATAGGSIPSPPFIWSTAQPSRAGSTVLPSASAGSDWPLLARAVFSKMASDEKRAEPKRVPPRPEDMGAASLAFGRPAPAAHAPTADGSIEQMLEELSDLGFEDEVVNRTLLEIFEGDLEQTLDCLLEGANVATLPSERMPATKTNEESLKKLPASAPAPPKPTEYEECFICASNIPRTPGQWKVLKCTHELCTACFKKLEKSGSTMAGQLCTYVKCPFCLACTGTEVGSCPNGTMTVTEIQQAVAGYEQYSTLEITYVCPGLNRTAYVPNSPEGKKVVELLKVAFDRRLCFAMGTSVSTGQQNVLCWNLHHKSALDGGVAAYGYPDPTYLTRVQLELAQYCIA